MSIYTLDLDFMGTPMSIAAYLIPHEHGAILIESGPASTLPGLQASLQAHGLSVKDVTDVFVTHIHLDHAGACGWLARQGARIHVHPVGAPHLLDPEKLLSSATRLYGEGMAAWGEFLPVPEGQLSVLQDEEVVEIGGLRVRAIDTPGHANHHYAYIIEDTCFSGDIGGVRLPGCRYLRLPMPPPEFLLESWRESLKRLQVECAAGAFSRIAPTHFGIFDDPAWHLAALQADLDEIEQWILDVMPGEPSVDELNQKLLEWTQARSQQAGLEPEIIKAYELANPAWISTQGILRYWKKYRQPPEG